MTNAQSGMEISFASERAKKLSGRKGDVLYRSVPALREILEKGTLTKTSPETKGRSHIKAWHAISATVMLDDMPCWKICPAIWLPTLWKPKTEISNMI